MKRTLIFLLLAVFITTTFTPCADWHSVEEVRTSNHEESEEDCSPFCGCACCGLPILPQALTVFEFFVNRWMPSPFSYTESEGANFNPSCWQPPKV